MVHQACAHHLWRPRPYLNTGVARRLHKPFPTSDLFLVSGARHYVQVNQPQRVANLIFGLQGNMT
jgi:hypothetical protein